jgi:hypothetical protein
LASTDDGDEAPAEAPVADEPATEGVAPDEHGDDETAEPEPEPAPAPDPDPEFEEPDLIVDEDGCVTDRNLGLVIMCEDPAAGPDEGHG